MARSVEAGIGANRDNTSDVEQKVERPTQWDTFLRATLDDAQSANASIIGGRVAPSEAEQQKEVTNGLKPETTAALFAGGKKPGQLEQEGASAAYSESARKAADSSIFNGLGTRRNHIPGQTNDQQQVA